MERTTASMAVCVTRTRPDQILLVKVISLRKLGFISNYLTFIFILMLYSLPDFSETCESSSGSMSVSRCQLFEAGFPADVLHLNDPSCKGTVRNGRVEFHFDNEEHICGTNLVVGCITYMLTKSICSQTCLKKSTANLYHLKSF